MHLVQRHNRENKWTLECSRRLLFLVCIISRQIYTHWQNRLEILLKHPLWRFRHILLFSFSLTFLSGFGQSFFISLFIPTFLETSNISNTTFGTLYALATLISGFSLPWAGRQLDHVSVARYSKVVFTGLVLACVVTAFSQSVYSLSLAIFLLRFFGQGLFGHTSDTITAKKFGANRGKL